MPSIGCCTIQCHREAEQIEDWKIIGLLGGKLTAVAKHPTIYWDEEGTRLYWTNIVIFNHKVLFSLATNLNQTHQKCYESIYLYEPFVVDFFVYMCVIDGIAPTINGTITIPFILFWHFFFDKNRFPLHFIFKIID